MLNGKFFTGLPPKMIDRGGSGGRNRLESHFFWPDDTKVDTAAESRIKRRNSVQLTNTERPIYEKHTSVTDNVDVDTKKRFSKEFSQSSIQFYDNLNENRVNSRRLMQRNAVGSKKSEITEKPTKTKLELPESVVDEAYTTAKKKQAYTSKIQFYDYVNEGGEPQNNRNNLRKPKMDMNDKREMELNTKNSPKLQIKRDARSLSEEKEQRKINNREVRAMENSAAVKDTDSYNQMRLNNEERYLRSRRSVEPRMNLSPRRGMEKTNDNYDPPYSSDRELYRESYDKRKPVTYDENFESRDYIRDSERTKPYENRRFLQRDENPEDNSYYRREREEPKKMLRNNSREFYEASDDRNYFREYQDEEEIRGRMRNLHMKSLPRKQYYQPEEYYDVESQHIYDHSDQIKTPTNRGSSQEGFDYNNRETKEVDLSYENNNTSKIFNKNNSNIHKINNEIHQKPLAPPTSPSPSDVDTISASKSHKHLRSSLCFNNGAIIAENDATQSPTSTSSSQYPTQRRNARSSATQRVSVGLPD